MVMHNWFMKKFISNIFTSVLFKIILSAPIKWLNKVVLLSKPKLNKYETWLGLQLNLNQHEFTGSQEIFVKNSDAKFI